MTGAEPIPQVIYLFMNLFLLLHTILICNQICLTGLGPKQLRFLTCKEKNGKEKEDGDCDKHLSFISHLSLNHEGRWGTKDDFATSFLRFSQFSTAL